MSKSTISAYALMKRMTEKCVICGKPVQYEGDPYCYECGRKSELEDGVVSEEGQKK